MNEKNKRIINEIINILLLGELKKYIELFLEKNKSKNIKIIKLPKMVYETQFF